MKQDRLEKKIFFDVSNLFCLSGFSRLSRLSSQLIHYKSARMIFLGEVAGIATAITWAGCGMFFTSAGKRIGVFSMNHYRVLWGCLFLFIAHIFILNTPWPNIPTASVITLFISGILGVVICDSFLFQSYVDIGPRLTMLIFTINPFFTTLIAKVFLGENLNFGAWIGMIVTLSGTIWVVSEEKKNKIRHPNNNKYIKGIIFAFFAAIFQSAGFVIAKPVMIGLNAADPLSASFLRVLAAVIGFWGIGLISGKTKKVLKDFKNKKAMRYLFYGVIIGPFIGIWLSMIALKYAPAAIASTLIATMPVMILPMVRIAYKEKITWKAIVGAIIAVIGVAILFNL